MHTLRQSQAGRLVVVAGLALATLACSVGLPAPTPTPTPLISADLATAVPPTITASPTVAVALEPTDTEEPEAEATEPEAAGTPAVGGADFVCTLIQADEVAEVLGAAAERMVPGVDDTDPAVILNFCTWNGRTQALVLSVADLDSADAAKAYLRAGLVDPEAPGTQREPDAILGDEVYWSVTETAVAYTVAYNNHAFSLGLGGLVTDSPELKAKLLEVAQAVAGRL